MVTLANENKNADQNLKMAASWFVVYVEIRPWATILMPSLVNLVKHSSEEMPSKQRYRCHMYITYSPNICSKTKSIH